MTQSYKGSGCGACCRPPSIIGGARMRMPQCVLLPSLSIHALTLIHFISDSLSLAHRDEDKGHAEEERASAHHPHF